MVSKKLVHLAVLLASCTYSGATVEKAAELDTSINLAAHRLPGHSHELGFSSLKKESQNSALTPTNALPAWLSGSFITIGPGVFELNQSKAIHWLDGFAMIHQFSLDKGKVIYNNKLIDSSYYQDCCKQGKLRGSTPEQKKSTWSKLTSAISSAPRPIYDNTNINIACYNKQLVALTETPHSLSINQKTLETTGKFVFDDTIEAHFLPLIPSLILRLKNGMALQFNTRIIVIILFIK